MKARLRIGHHGLLGGVEWRIVPGDKGPDDQVLQIRTGGWVHVPMALGMLMAQFFFDNEERLYPQQFGYRGGWLYLDVAAKAALRGFEPAAVELVRLRKRAGDRRRRENPA